MSLKYGLEMSENFQTVISSRNIFYKPSMLPIPPPPPPQTPIGQLQLASTRLLVTCNVYLYPSANYGHSVSLTAIIIIEVNENNAKWAGIAISGGADP